MFCFYSVGEDTYLSVCKPLIGTLGLKCPQHSAVCHRTAQGDSAVSYGVPQGPPQLMGVGKYVLSYVNGSVCRDNKTRFSSSVVFTCQRDRYPGAPVHNAASSSR